MATKRGKWESIDSSTANIHSRPDIREKIERLNSRKPIATIELRIYSTRRGDSTAQVDMPDPAPFVGTEGTFGDAYEALARICLRELRNGLAALASIASEMH